MPASVYVSLQLSLFVFLFSGIPITLSIHLYLYLHLQLSTVSICIYNCPYLNLSSCNYLSVSICMYICLYQHLSTVSILSLCLKYLPTRSRISLSMYSFIYIWSASLTVSSTASLTVASIYNLQLCLYLLLTTHTTQRVDTFVSTACLTKWCVCFSTSYLVSTKSFVWFARLPANRFPDTCVDIANAALDLQFQFRFVFFFIVFHFLHSLLNWFGTTAQQQQKHVSHATQGENALHALQSSLLRCCHTLRMRYKYF